MGLKQAKKDVYHGWALAGDLELTNSPGRASTSFKRAVHSAMSSVLTGPPLLGGGGLLVLRGGHCD
jgi:hypothetical protein